MWQLIQQVKAAGTLGEITPIVTPASRFSNIEGLISGIIDFIFLFVGGLAVLAVVYSGIMYITAGGDAAKAEKAKNNLVWAIIGVVVAVLALVIIGWVNSILNRGTA